MAKTFILKNLTGTEQYIPDLGVYLPASGQVNVTEVFNNRRFEPYASTDLIAKVNADIITINDGTADITKASATAWLEKYSIDIHDIVSEHTGDLPETRVADGAIFPRLNAAETINGVWTFNSAAGGQLRIESGTTLPTGTIANGRMFWDTALRRLYVGANGVWSDIATTINAFYSSPLIYEFGTYNNIGSGYLNTQWYTSSTSPVIVPRPGTIKSLAVDCTLGRGTVTGYTMEIRRWSGSNWVSFSPTPAIIQKTDGVGYKIFANMNVDFAAQERMACYATTQGSNTPEIDNAHCYMEVIWREE